VRQKFTGYESDNETGLYFAQARYYSNIQGRFSTPDEPLFDQIPEEPQSWNLYAYVRNNPSNNTDPTGRETCYYQDGKQIACDDWKDVKIKDNVLFYKGKEHLLRDLHAETVVRDSLTAVGHQQNIPCGACSAPSRFDPSKVKGIPTGEVPQLVPIVSGFRDFSNSTTGQVLMTFVPLPGNVIAQALLRLKFLVRPGVGKNVVEIVGKVDDAKALFDELRGANAATQVAPGVFTAKPYAGAGTVTFRASSKSGPPTIDVHGIGEWRKIKFVPQ
jgi:RHS repeat-associated protein